jgi:hypothetical protein
MEHRMGFWEIVGTTVAYIAGAAMVLSFVGGSVVGVVVIVTSWWHL